MTKLDNEDRVQHLKSGLIEGAKKYYVEESAIQAVHPAITNHVENYLPWDAASVLVSERYRKGDLTNLVGYLLCKIRDLEAKNG